MSKLSALKNKLENAKPSNMDDEKREITRQRIKTTLGYVGAALLIAAPAIIVTACSRVPEDVEFDTETEEI